MSSLQATAQNNFYTVFFETLAESLPNNFADNYDADRFGKAPRSFAPKNLAIEVLQTKFINSGLLKERMQRIQPHLHRFAALYDLLADAESKQLLVKLACFKLLGHKKVKLPVNTNEYWKNLDDLKKLEDKTNAIDSQSAGFKLGLFDLKKYGYDLKLYYGALGVLIDFVIEQYAYRGETTTIEVKPGDTVIDAGGCWGDTALYFAHKTGDGGKVYSFEFIPNNIEIFKQNVELNPNLKNQINLVQNPLWSKPDLDVYYKDCGPGSRVSFEPFDDNTGASKTETIDNLVETNSIEKVDFIKMDIEGAEPAALTGAEKTIRRFKPALAIAIYHSYDDFFNIPAYVDSLGLGYRLFLKHTTIHEEETVIFASCAV